MKQHDASDALHGVEILIRGALEPQHLLPAASHGRTSRLSASARARSNRMRSWQAESHVDVALAEQHGGCSRGRAEAGTVRAGRRGCSRLTVASILAPAPPSPASPPSPPSPRRRRRLPADVQTPRGVRSAYVHAAVVCVRRHPLHRHDRQRACRCSAAVLVGPHCSADGPRSVATMIAWPRRP